MNTSLSMGHSATILPTFRVTVTTDAVFLSGKPWSGFSTLTSGLLKAAARVVSSTGDATVTAVSATNYTGRIREIFAEPMCEDEDMCGTAPSLFSKLAHGLSLLSVAKRGGHWMATPQNVKKIIPGDMVVAMPSISPAIRNVSFKVMFPDNELHNVIVARVTAIRDADFSRRPMNCVSFSGARGIVCDGLMLYA